MNAFQYAGNVPLLIESRQDKRHFMIKLLLHAPSGLSWIALRFNIQQNIGRAGTMDFSALNLIVIV